MPLWFGFLGIRKALAAVFAVALKYPFQALCIALVLFGAWEWRGWNRAQAALGACESGRKADRASYVAAQQEALKRAVAAKAAQEAAYKLKAEKADHDHEAQLASVRAATDEFIRTHRVRYQAPSGSSGPAPASAQDSGAAVPPEPAPGSLVAVSEADVTTCAQDYSYARAAFEWAQGLGK